MTDDIRPEEILAVHAYDWTIRDAYGDDDHVVVHCWALDNESHPHLLRFTNFPAFCHIELPLFVRNRLYEWRKESVASFMSMLSQHLGADAPVRYTFKQAKKTYYYRGNRTFPMLQVCFNTLKAMQHCSRLLQNPLKTDDWGFIKCNVWEDSISIVRKLLTVRDVRYSQWFRVNATQVEPELCISTLEREYIAQWDTMVAIPPEESKGWTTKPGVLAFDIECYSNNHRAMPDKYNALHVAYMISCIYQRYREPTSRRRYGIIIGDCNHIPFEKFINCEIIRVNSEYEMIEAFARVVALTDPEILTGYNILGFDYPYLDHRVKRWLKQWPTMGRISGETATMTNKTWKSGAYGYQSINILQMEGRVSIDLLPIVKRDYKLDKYDLNTVCKKFIGKTKHDVKASEMFLIYEDMRAALTVLINIRKEALETPDLEQDPGYIKRKIAAQGAFEQAKEETTRVMEYCIQDSELVIELMEKLNIWIGLLEMSNIVGITIVELFTRGQQIRCYSQLYDLAARMGFVLDKRDVPGFRFAGGFVYEPIPGLYDNVICLDFASLYPSIMMAYNICYTTLVPPELENTVPDEECHIIEFDQDEIEGTNVEDDEDDEEVLVELTEKAKKQTTIKRHYRFKFYKLREGLLPRLVRQLVMERRAVNKQIVQLKDELKALEKIGEIQVILEAYLAETLQIGTIKEATKRVKELAATAPPEIIVATKRELTAAQLFDTEETNKKLEDMLKAKIPAHPTLIDLAHMERDIAHSTRDELGIKLAQLQETKQARIAKIEATKLLIVVLDKRQWALKISANSFFGFLGVHNGGKMPLIEAAMSITAKGRELIGLVREYIEKTYGGTQIYSDTDSCMFILPHIKDSKECNYWGTRLAQEISGIKPGEKDCDGILWEQGRPGLFPPPLAMEFEKAMRMLCIKKKKYAALLIGKDGNFKTEDVMDKHGNIIGTILMMLKKGIVLARRDNCAFLRKTYTKILSLIMNKGELNEAITVLVDAIQELLDGKVPYEDLVIIRELGANYKSESYFMKVFSDELRKTGKIVNPGDRLDFVIVEDPTATLLGHKMRLTEQYSERLNGPNPERIDYNYYIEKILMNPINQLFEVGFKDIIAKLSHFYYRPTNRHKPIDLNRPVQIILKMRERGYDLKIFKEAIHYNVMKLKGHIPIALNVITTSVPIPAVQPTVELTPKPLTLNIMPLKTAPNAPTLIMPPIGLKTPTKRTSPVVLNINHRTPVQPIMHHTTLAVIK